METDNDIIAHVNRHAKDYIVDRIVERYIREQAEGRGGRLDLSATNYAQLRRRAFKKYSTLSPAVKSKSIKKIIEQIIEYRKQTGAYEKGKDN